MLPCERIAAMVWSAARRASEEGGADRSGLLRAAWRALLECQFHDTLAGTTTDAVQREQAVRLDAVRAFLLREDKRLEQAAQASSLLPKSLWLARLAEAGALGSLDPERRSAIWKTIDETARDEWGYRPFTEEDYLSWTRNPSFQPDLWQVAWDPATDSVVGHVLTYIDHAENEQAGRKRGYTEGIGVVPAWRRRGTCFPPPLRGRVVRCARLPRQWQPAGSCATTRTSDGFLLFSFPRSNFFSWTSPRADCSSVVLKL